MAKAARNSSNGRDKGGNGASNGSYRIFEDIVALAGTLARGRKDFGAGKLHSLAKSTREFAASMSELPNLRGHVATAAESLEGLADYVTDTEVDQMIEDAGIFARRHPFATLAASVAAGMAASRYMWPRTATSNPSAHSVRRRASGGRKNAARSRRSTQRQASVNG